MRLEDGMLLVGWQVGDKLADMVDAAERAAIEATIKATRGNQSAAARMLGINRKTLRDRLTRYHLARRKAQQLDMFERDRFFARTQAIKTAEPRP